MEKRPGARRAPLRWLAFALIAKAAYAQASQASQIADLQARCTSLQTQDFSTIPDAPTQVTTTTAVDGTGKLPAHCQLHGYIAPNIGIQILLPSAWNGKLLEVGCAGHCGSLDERYQPMACVDALRRNYACIASDMGHSGTGRDGLWSYDNLQAKLDWGYRATHVVALAGKVITARYYQSEPRKSYFFGCSTGGRQALQEAQRFPWDFDGIVAGAPPVNLSSIYMTFAWGIRAARDANGKQLLQKADLKLLSDAVIAKCDLDDGVRDGVVSDPRHCPFDPAALMCKLHQTADCLMPAQVDAVKQIYAGPMTSDGTKLSLGGPLAGADLTSYVGIDGTPPVYETLATNGLRFLFFMPALAPTWTLDDFDFDRDYRRLGVMQFLYDSSNPDLQKFKDAGGKLLIFQGLNDSSVLPRDTIDYYEKVERTMGGRSPTQSFVRLFVLPGVGHCRGGGNGADTVDYLSAMEAWVEKGQAPDQLTAARVNEPNRKRPFWLGADPRDTVFTRPVYPYPLKARYRGSGNPNDVASFVRVPH